MTVVDLFAGAGGWDVGARAIGLDPWGVENWAPAIATRDAAGLRTLVHDLADPWPIPETFDGLIASPPCPDWSLAGSRAKRDGKTGWLVDVPMEWARTLRPRWIAWEQVPPALEVWEVNADELRTLGYSVWTGVLNAANYGVPQTRERAFLLASLDRPALPPEPTHARDPQPSLFGPQLERWVSMRVAGIDDDMPATTVTGDPRLSERCHHDTNQQNTGPRLTIQQASVLQTFPADYPWQGNKGDQFKQVGNAVPPLLAAQVLGAITGRT